MQVSYNLLKEYVDIDLTPEELAERLSMKGIVAEHVRPVLEGVKGVLVGKINSIKSLEVSEGSSNLSICTVDIKNQELEVVCGAKNMKVGDYIPFVTEGGSLPAVGRIEGKSIQGIFSKGMICSASELGLEKGKSTGVLILDNKLPLGERIENIPGLGDDVIFDFEIFSNRPDLMSIIGIAREISAFTGKSLHKPEIKITETEERVTDRISVEVKDEDLCPRYAGRIVKGVEVKESSFWLRWKLLLLGIRPINNIVDVTNYVMMETGQPLHAFDLDFIHGQKIIIRRANPGEIFRTLDGVERILTKENLVIADCDRAIALAGVMGGENSEITERTKNVFLESAYFDPINNRRTSRYFALRTDASNRFEKGIDPDGQIFALNRAASLIEQLTPCKNLAGVIDQCSNKFTIPKKIRLNFDKVKRIIGTNIAETESEAKDNIINILTKLEFKINNQEQYFLEVTPPSFRGDIQREVDVIEEIARLFGYENIPATLFKSTVVQKGRCERQIIVEKIRNVLVSCGMHQMIGYSMIAPSCFDWLKLPVSHYLRQAIKLTNPLIQDQTIMRTTLIPGLLKAIQWNVNHSMEKIKLFEIGRVYLPQENKPDEPLPVEKLMVGGVVTKIGRGDIWEKSEKWDIFYLKGILEALFEELHLSDLDYLPGELPIFDPEQNGIIKAGNKKIAVWGKVEQDITNFWDIPANVYLFELNFTELYPLIEKDITFKPLPRYPFMKRDISIVIPEEVAFAQIQKEILKVNPILIKRVELFDIFRGKQIKKGYKSIAFSIVFQAEERTLTDIEVDKIMESVKMKLYQLFQAELRE